MILYFPLLFVSAHSLAHPKSAPTHSAITRQVILFNEHWQYLEQSTTDVAAVMTNSDWHNVTLPHSWNSTDTVDDKPGYRRSASWYRRKITTKASGRYVLHFEGANMQTTVYVNGQRAGESSGGYLGFDIELTSLLKPAQSNDIQVRVDNSYQPDLIPSQKADFFLYGGITRDVWLNILPNTYLQDLQISTTDVASGQVKTNFSIMVNQSDNKLKSYTLHSRLLQPDGSEVLQHQQQIEATGHASISQVNLPEVQRPELWSPETPALYTLQVELQDKNGKIIDRIEERFGYRWFEMRPNAGFFINGKKLLIRGTHRHEEFAGIGPALSNAQHRQDMQQIKDMGANFVRLAHYPQDPEVYRAADELGLILWDELPWVRGGKGNAAWETNTENYLKRQIRQNYNHPSIAFWSLGNEMDWEEDVSGGGAPAVVTPYLRKLNTIVKSLDSSRLTTLRKYPPGADIVDAYSPSIWTGWYGGAYQQYAEALETAMKQYPHLIHMEYGGSSHVGRHTETPIGPGGLKAGKISVNDAMNQTNSISIAKASDWSESYIVDLFDWHLHISEKTPNFSGNAQWAFRDFGTPLRPDNPIPYVNQKGLYSRDGVPKDAYYVFASYWSKKPFCQIMSKSWTYRQGPLNGRPVRVYCNTEYAELFLNGNSLGRLHRDISKFPAGGLVWQVPFMSGDNQLKVVGTNEHIQVVNSLNVHYVIGEHGVLHQVQLTTLTRNDDSLMITAEAIDKEGRRVLSFNERAYFSNLTDSGHFSQDQGTPTGTRRIEFANGVASILFYPGDAPTVVELVTQNVKGVYISIPQRSSR